MAKEAWTVFYEVEDSGAQQPANWKETEIAVAASGKTKNSGLFASSQQALGTGSSKILEKSALIKNTPQQARFVTIEAEGAEEAAQALRVFYGQSTVLGKVLACATTNLSETSAQP